MSYGYIKHDSSFDALWLYEPEQRYSQPLVDRYKLKELIDRSLRDMRDFQTPGGIPPKISKEKPEMGYNDRILSSQEQIDAAVREAIEKPRREAEIAKRVAAVTALEPLATVDAGTVITFTRKINKSTYTYAAVKSNDDLWFVTGDGHYTNGERKTFDSLLQWMTTGETLAENVQRVTATEPVSALEA